MRGELAPTIPRQRLHETVRQPADATSERSNDRVGFLGRQAHEHDVARLALDEGGNEGSPRPFQQVTFPVARQRAIRDVSGPLTIHLSPFERQDRGRDAPAGDVGELDDEQSGVGR